MNWYRTLIADTHGVLCYGCNEYQHIDTSEWMAKRSDPACWRCSTCRNSLDKTAREKENTRPRDRSMAQEFTMRERRNDRDQQMGY